jgi:hypothetical protein
MDRGVVNILVMPRLPQSRLTGQECFRGGPAIFRCAVCEQPVVALKDNAELVHDAAKRGDLDFFLEIAKAFSRSKRRKKRAVNVKEISMWNVLSRWLHGCLWLMSADRGSIAAGEMTGVRITESNYTKVCQRLGLVGWKVAHKKPIINGYSPRTKRFLFAEGWTHLDSLMSK